MMTLRRPLAAVLLCLSALALHPGAGCAQSAKIFVSITGSDASTGTSGAPMRTFQAAHDAVAAGGEIVVENTGGYGSLVITKAVSIATPPGITAFITNTGNTNGVYVNAGSGDVISLRGLTIEGGGNPASGIQISSASEVRVEDCTIHGFANGILLVGATADTLIVRGGSIYSVDVGIYASGTVMGQNQTVVVTGCAIDKALNYALAASSATYFAFTTISATGCTFANCGTSLYAVGGFGIGMLDNCTVVANGSGVTASAGGSTYSRGNNLFFLNGSNGSFTNTLAPL